MSEPSLTSQLLMIRPVHFDFNAETAVNNSFQAMPENTDALQTGSDTQIAALREFDDFVGLLRANDIQVTVVEDTPLPHTPDSIFPNNWISFHPGGIIVLYPMFAPNRRAERKPSVLTMLREHYQIEATVDLTAAETQGRYLEGTGSLVLDRAAGIAYGCISPRTDKELAGEFCHRMNYRPMLFTATDDAGDAIYHTNVLMCVGERFVVICLDCIPDTEERKLVEQHITDSGKIIVPISRAQLNEFAGNMLQLVNAAGQRLLAMSSRAFRSLNAGQLEQLSIDSRILHSPLDTIERNGGGSARCMMAEIFLQQTH